jgi:hypothetical protein
VGSGVGAGDGSGVGSGVTVGAGVGAGDGSGDGAQVVSSAQQRAACTSALPFAEAPSTHAVAPLPTAEEPYATR